MSTLRSKNTSVNPQASNSTKPPSGITWGSELSISVFNGLDTLHLGLFVIWPENSLFFEKLNEFQLAAQEADKPVPFQIEQTDLFLIHPRGRRGGYKWHLSAGDQHLFFSSHTEKGETPNLFVEIGSMSCWSPGYQTVIKSVVSFIESVGGYILRNKLSRMDMASDLVGVNFNDVNVTDKRCWIKRARKYNTHGAGIDDNSINIGLGGQFSLRIYDKKLEVNNNLAKKKFFYENWGLDLTDKSTPVLRVEYQIRKKGLKQFRLLSINDIPKYSESLWQYCTTDWFRISEKPVNRTHQKEAETDNWWQFVQSIKWSGIDKTQRHKLPCLKSEKLYLDMIFGCALNLAAINKIPAQSLDEVTRYILYCLEVEFRGRLHQDPGDFKKRYETKLAETWGMGS